MRRALVSSLLLVFSMVIWLSPSLASAGGGAELVQVNPPIGSDAIPIWGSSPMGQEFHPATSTLSAIGVYLSFHGSVGSTVTLNLWENEIGGAFVAGSTRSVSCCASGWWDFEFASPVSVVTGGPIYVIELTATNVIPWWVLGAALPDGDAILEGYYFPDFSFAFRTYAPTNNPPDLDAIAGQSVYEGGTLTVGLSASDADGDGLTLSAVGLPGFATLTDNGDGSGSIYFAPGFEDEGVYVIEVTVSDGDLSDTESFTLTVNAVAIPSPRQIKETVMDDLSAYERESKLFKKAIAAIENSLEDKLWVDDIHLNPKHGNKVFDWERHAIKNLMQLIKKPDGLSAAALTEAQLGVYALLNSDRLLAVAVIDDASGETAADPKRGKHVDRELAKAQEELAKGDTEREIGKFDKAVNHYKKAWNHAMKAVRELTM